LLLIQERYGGLAGLFYSLGLFNLFRSLWFRLPLSLLIINVTICTINRIRSTWRLLFNPKVRLPEALFQKGPLLASLVADSLKEGAETVQETLLHRRYRLLTKREGDTLYIRADKNRMARLGSLITHLSLILLLISAFWIQEVGWREEVSLLPGEVRDIGPGLFRVASEGLQIERYPGGQPKEYRAYLTLFDGECELEGVVVRVNEPLTWRGVSLYLKSYESIEASTAGPYLVTLMAVHDPGFLPVILSAFLMLGGLMASFYLPHRSIWAKLTERGEIFLTARAEVDKEGLSREFWALVEEIKERL
jgi:cytochrome c biogenesis protein